MKAQAARPILPEPNIPCSHTLSMNVNEDQNSDLCLKININKHIHMSMNTCILQKHNIHIVPIFNPSNGISHSYQLVKSIYL